MSCAPLVPGVMMLTLTLLGCSPRRDGPVHPAEARLERLIEAINAVGSEPSRAGAFVEDAFGASMMDAMPPARHTEMLLDVAARSGGLEPRSTTVLGPFEASAQVETALDGTPLVVTVTVDPEPPHRIASIRLGSARADGSVEEEPTGPGEVAAALDDYLRGLSERDAFSGVVLLHGPDGVVYQGAFGLADRSSGRAIRVDTPFDIASLGKMFTAVLIARAVEDGYLGFDDPVSMHLPGYLTPATGDVVTIAHLLSHTSGLDDTRIGPGTPAGPDAPLGGSEWLAGVRGTRVAIRPGTSWAYSNAGYLVLGAVLESVTGRDYPSLLREQVLDPAGMTGTFLPGAAGSGAPGSAPSARGYERTITDDGLVVREHDGGPVGPAGPAGGAHATAQDLVLFFDALFSGRLVETETLRELLRPRPASPDYGLGFRLWNDGEVIGHLGGAPGASASAQVVLPRGIVAVVLSNRGTGAQPVTEWLHRRLGVR